MRTTTIVKSPGAIALGCLFALGTAAVLFWDVRNLSDITSDHLMTFLVLVGTICSGHMFATQLRAFNVFGCVGLGALFLAGTLYCVTQSAARNVETSIPKLLDTLNINEQRKKVEADIAEAKVDLRKATVAAERACATGIGPRCQGANKTRDQADSHYWMAVGRLANMKPAQIENAGFKHAAKVIALFPLTGTEASIERAMGLLFPVAKAAFLEIATVVFFGLGFGHRRVPVGTMTLLPAPETVSTVSPTVMETVPRDWVPKSVSEARELAKKCEAEQVFEALRRAARPVCNDELADFLECSKGESSKKVTALESLGLINRARNGRYVAISLKPLIA